MRTILATNNSEIFYETKGTAYLGVVENGKIILGDAGFEFEYKNLRRGQNIFFTWSSIKSAEVDVSISGKLGQQFSLILDTQAKVRFSSKDSGSILKKVAEYVGKENIVRAPSLLDPFRRAFKK
ncbi:regulator [Lactococcus lactis subsp. lactis]|nr:regulator [Lactococcus lactis subsp. lactis]